MGTIDILNKSNSGVRAAVFVIQRIKPKGVVDLKSYLSLDLASCSAASFHLLAVSAPFS